MLRVARLNMQVDGIEGVAEVAGVLGRMNVGDGLEVFSGPSAQVGQIAVDDTAGQSARVVWRQVEMVLTASYYSAAAHAMERWTRDIDWRASQPANRGRRDGTAEDREGPHYLALNVVDAAQESF